MDAIGPKTQLVTAMGKLLAVDPEQLAREPFTTSEREALRRRLDEALEKVTRLRVELERWGAYDD